MGTRPKTGEARKVRQPLNIDRLSDEMIERIQTERAKGRSWKRMETESPTWMEWQTVEPEVIEMFPGKQLSHTTLHRWYDLRVEQVRKEVLDQTETARQFAESFKARGFEGTDEALINAIRDQVFSLLRGTGEKDQGKFLKALTDFGWLLAQFKRIEVQRDKVGLERDKLALIAAKTKGLKTDAEKKQLTTDELKHRLDEIYGLAS